MLAGGFAATMFYIDQLPWLSPWLVLLAFVCGFVGMAGGVIRQHSSYLLYYLAFLFCSVAACLSFFGQVKSDVATLASAIANWERGDQEAAEAQYEGLVSPGHFIDRKERISAVSRMIELNAKSDKSLKASSLIEAARHLQLDIKLETNEGNALLTRAEEVRKLKEKNAELVEAVERNKQSDDNAGSGQVVEKSGLDALLPISLATHVVTEEASLFCYRMGDLKTNGMVQRGLFLQENTVAVAGSKKDTNDIYSYYDENVELLAEGTKLRVLKSEIRTSSQDAYAVHFVRVASGPSQGKEGWISDRILRLNH